MAHQLQALDAARGRRHFAYLMEQGTGKTWTILAEAEHYYEAGKLDCLFVLAPKGVHTNWTRREIPAHVGCAVRAAAWTAGAGKRARDAMNRMLVPGDEPALRIVAMNFEALLTKDGYAFALAFLKSGRTMFAVDESVRIKTPSAGVTKRVMMLREHAVVRRIASGAPMTNSPIDIFSQFEFLKPGLFGTSSYRAFVAEFAEVMPATHPLVQNLVKRNPKAAFAQLIARHIDGSPRWRNLHRLREMVAAHSFRVLKSECLDLPEKIYKRHFFDLPPELRAIYDKCEEELRVQLDDGCIETVSALASMTKLRQITSCHVNVGGEVRALYAAKDNPRLQAFLELVPDIEGAFIVWAHFRAEIDQIIAALAAAKISAVAYHGGVGTAEREAAVDRFQSGDARVFVGQPKAGGIGLTLTRAETAIYYSNDFNMGVRVQSEDRCHRIGTTGHVVYIDLMATDTIDEPIASALQRKTAMAAAVLDARRLDVGALGLDGDAALASTRREDDGAAAYCLPADVEARFAQT